MNSSSGRGSSFPFVVPLNSFGNACLLLFNCALATIVVCLNISVFGAIIISRTLRVESRFIYMLSTCLSDIGSGISWYYIGMFDVIDAIAGKNNTYFIGTNFLGISYLVILAAQADRYHAVVSPFLYSERMTPIKTVLIIGCLWLYAYVILIAQNLVTSEIALKITSVGTLVCNMITLVIMLGFNVKLYFLATYQLEREPPSQERDTKRSSLHLIIIVAGVFLLVWTPIFLYIIFCNFTPITCYKFYNDGTNPLKILPRVNSAVTPMLYIRGCAPLRQRLYQRVWNCSPLTGR